MIDKMVKPYTMCVDLIANVISTEVFYILLLSTILCYIIKLAKCEGSLLKLTKTFFAGKFSGDSCNVYNKILVTVFIVGFCLMYHVVGDYNFILLNSSVVLMLVIHYCYRSINKYFFSGSIVSSPMLISVKIFIEAMYLTFCVFSVIYIGITLFELSKILNPFSIVSSVFS